MKTTLLIFSITIFILLIQCCKSSTQINCPNTITDIDGNIYNVVKIGDKCWMKENLKTIHYRDGSTIEEANDSVIWSKNFEKQVAEGAWCYYESDSTNNKSFGKLYNWHAVTDVRGICPVGWHVPSDSEWHSFVLAVDRNAVSTGIYWGQESLIAGGKMKTSNEWNPPNPNSDNSTGFTGIPSGYRNPSGSFSDMWEYSGYWSTTLLDSGFAWNRVLYFGDEYLTRGPYEKESGFSCRCVKD